MKEQAVFTQETDFFQNKRDSRQSKYPVLAGNQSHYIDFSGDHKITTVIWGETLLDRHSDFAHDNTFRYIIFLRASHG